MVESLGIFFSFAYQFLTNDFQRHFQNLLSSKRGNFWVAQKKKLPTQWTKWTCTNHTSSMWPSRWKKKLLTYDINLHITLTYHQNELLVTSLTSLKILNHFNSKIQLLSYSLNNKYWIDWPYDLVISSSLYEMLSYALQR